MRMLPVIVSRSATTPKQKAAKEEKKKKKRESRRRSWHIGSSLPGGGRRSRSTSRETSTREGRHSTWHFPKLSRHSLHWHGTSHSHRHTNHHHKDADLEQQLASDHAKDWFDDPENTSIRKTFSYAPHAQPSAEESTTKAPSPPGSTEPESFGKSADRKSSSPRRRDPWLRKCKRRVSNWVHALEDFLFPGIGPLHQSSHKRSAHSRDTIRVRGGILLRNCLTAEEHKAKIQDVLDRVKDLHGQEGLRAVGMEFRMVPCPEHETTRTTATAVMEDLDDSEGVNEEEGGCNEMEALVSDLPNGAFTSSGLPPLRENITVSTRTTTATTQTFTSTETEVETNMTLSERDNILLPQPLMLPMADEGDADDECCATKQQQHFCPSCATRLFHMETNTAIDSDNRKLFIADGEMYDAIARLCQETAQEIMQTQYNLQWITVSSLEEEATAEVPPHLFKRNPDEPVRALVNAEHPLLHDINPGNVSQDEFERFACQPTLLIVTGKGKVRAGIFSRQYIMLQGLEASTAIPLIHEARLRSLNVVILDPNVHGDGMGMITFEKSMAKLFRGWEQSGVESLNIDNRDLYILSHSASGSQLARYLMEKSDKYVPHIKAIAFTDSTHNVQWVRKNGNDALLHLLESPACIYFRCANADKDSNWHLHHAGEPAPCDNFWKHRFGNIKTCWAGTEKHSLTNWFAHGHIWDHFDKILLTNDDPEMDGKPHASDSGPCHGTEQKQVALRVVA